jgi:outer membrane protein assembly factor BamB
LVYGDLVIVASQAPEAGVVAYDKLTGDLKWKTPSLGSVGYVSPAIVKIAGEDHIVMVTAAEMVFPGGRPPQGPPRQDRPAQGDRSQERPAQGDRSQERPAQGDRRQDGPPQGAEFRPTLTGGKVVGISPDAGEILWEYANWQCMIPIPSAFDAGDGKLLIVGGYNAGAAMLKIDKQADGSYSVAELFKNPDFGDHTKPPVFHNGYFYAQYSTNEKRDGLVCMRMDGRIMWKTSRNPSFDKGSMVLADGLILATDGMQKLYLIEPDSTGFRQLASAEVLKAGETGTGEESTETRYGGATRNWGPIALADGKLLLRDQTRLVCVRVAK